MMRPIHFVITASGNSQPIPLDRYVNGYGIAVTRTSAMKVNYTVQYSFDDPFINYSTSYAVSANWFNMDDPVMVNQSANRASNFAFPPAAVRVVTTTFSAGGGATPAQLTLHIMPMGMDGN
jgi:hypothetical protein